MNDTPPLLHQGLKFDDFSRGYNLKSKDCIMNLLSLLTDTDNITELLIKVIEFTQMRQKILARNINNIDSPGFVPKDLAVKEFCVLLHKAINKHITNRCLVLSDSENVKFSNSGSFDTKPIIDKYAKELLEENQDEYLALQINKLFENSLNQRVAAELLRQKQEMISAFK
jgi:flagellar basal body rod protein FlgB